MILAARMGPIPKIWVRVVPEACTSASMCSSRSAIFLSGSVVVTQVDTRGGPPEWPYPRVVFVTAVEAKPVAGAWSVEAEAICAKMGTP
jgi:hypothetical protein